MNLTGYLIKQLSEQCIPMRIMYLDIVYCLVEKGVRHFGGWPYLPKCRTFCVAITIFLSTNIYALYLQFVSRHHHRRRQLREVKNTETACFLPSGVPCIIYSPICVIIARL